MAVGIIIAVVALIWLGMSRVFEKGNNYAVYFNESVQGLSVDSPVKYRGVAIGRVERIGVAADSKMIEVIIIIDSGQKLEEDMVAQLRAVGITGSMFIELDRPGKVAGLVFKPSFPTEYQVVGSRPSEISELFRGIDDIIQKLNSLDINGISDRLKKALDHIDQQVLEADVAGVSARMKTALHGVDQALTNLDLAGISGQVKTTLASLNKDLDPERWDKVINGLEKTVVSLDGIVENTNKLLANTSNTVADTGLVIINLNRRLNGIGRELESASRNLSGLVEQLADQPSQLLFGNPPEPRAPFSKRND